MSFDRGQRWEAVAVRFFRNRNLDTAPFDLERLSDILIGLKYLYRSSLGFSFSPTLTAFLNFELGFFQALYNLLLLAFLAIYFVRVFFGILIHFWVNT